MAQSYSRHWWGRSYVIDSKVGRSFGERQPETVTNALTGSSLSPIGFAMSRGISFANRFSFSKASRFICNFICEYFLKTWESPCRSN